LKITDEDIASLQVIVYTDYEESQLEILLKARKLIEAIAEKSKMDVNEKNAITYLLDVLCTNMLNETEYEQYMEETVMLINPVERYCLNKGREEGEQNTKLKIAKKLLAEGHTIDYVSKISGLSKKDIQNII
jgi:predicted transposase/invertase (TIGR01784 family)